MSPSPVPDHPRLPAWLRPYVRRPGEVQFGLRPGAPVVDGVTPQEAALLAGLDGSLTREQTYAVAVDAGVGRRRWRDVLLLAASLGVLVDAKQKADNQRVTKVVIEHGVMTQSTQERQENTYTIRNRDTSARAVVIEHPARPGWKLTDDRTSAGTSSRSRAFW